VDQAITAAIAGSVMLAPCHGRKKLLVVKNTLSVTVCVHRAQQEEEASKQEPGAANMFGMLAHHPRGAANMLGMLAHHTLGTPVVQDRCKATTQTHTQAAFTAAGNPDSTA
jgi:hypothetical protein